MLWGEGQGCGSGSAWIRINLNGCWLYLDPQYSGKSWIRIRIHSKGALDRSFSLEAQNRAVKGCGFSQWRRGGLEWSSGGPVNQWSQICIILWEAGSGSAVNWKEGSGPETRTALMRISNPRERMFWSIGLKVKDNWLILFFLHENKRKFSILGH